MNYDNSAKSQTSEIEELINRVGAIHKRLSDTIRSMEQTADRTMGSWPVAGSCGENSVESPNGLISAFHAALEVFERDVHRASEAAERLSRL